MPLPSSGPITMAQVAAEIGISASGLSLNDGSVRQLAGKPSGAISFADLLGKAWAYLNITGVSSRDINMRNSYSAWRDQEFTISVSASAPWNATASVSNNGTAISKVASDRFRVSAKYEGEFRGTIYFTVSGGGITKTASADYWVSNSSF